MKYIRILKDISKKISYMLDKSQKRWAVVVLVCIFIGAMVETLGVSVIVPLVQAMLSPEVIRRALETSVLHISTENITNNELILLLSIGVVIIYIIKNIYLIFLSYIRSWYSCKIQKETAVKMMNSYMKRGYPYFLNTNVSKLLRGVGGDVSGLYGVISHIFKIFTEGLTAFCICIFIMITDYKMALAIAAIGIVCIIVIINLFKNKMSKYGKIYRKYIGITNQSSIQAFEGIKEILVMRREQFFTNQFRNSYEVMQKANVIQSVASESPAYMIEAACVTGMIVIICIRMMGSSDLNALIPQLAAFAVAAFRILPSLGRISSAVNGLIYSIPSMNACYENVSAANQYEESTDLRKVGVNDENKLEFNEKVEIRNVSWKYSETGPDILKDISFDIIKGTSVAFIGQSGAGRTTLADVILGLLKPYEGDVTVGGKSIFTSPKSWAGIVGFVPQSVYLTDDTIRKNVAFGVEEEDIDDNKVWRALEQAQLAEFVKGLPDGLDNIVGDRGIKISGGQRQRIAIARALYEEPEILVLDEATSALDTETESAVMEAIDFLHGKKTMIIIAHRLTTIQNCDTVYEVKNGSISAVRKKNE